MSGAGRMSVSDLDMGLKALKVFVKASFVDDKTNARDLVVDQDYEFTVYTKLPKQLNQEQGELQKHVVKIPQGTKLHFFGSSGKDKTNFTDFMVNDGDGAWRINTFTKSVRHLNHNVHVGEGSAKAIFNTRINGNGFGRR